eukprot:762134-Prymnesium_polylepis.1
MMLTGLAPATGSAAPDCMRALGEQPGRPEIGRPHEGGRSPCGRQLRQLAAASLAERIQEERLEAARDHAFELCRWLSAGNGVSR